MGRPRRVRFPGFESMSLVIGSRSALAPRVLRSVRRRRGVASVLLAALSVSLGCGGEVNSVIEPGTLASQGGDRTAETQREMSSPGPAPSASSSDAAPSALGSPDTGSAAAPPAGSSAAGEGAVGGSDSSTAAPPPAGGASTAPASEPSSSSTSGNVSPPPATVSPPTTVAPRPPAASGPLGLETQCTGQDDDGNGVIDDVDVGGDGICDCLSVAVLGLHGEWGQGDALSGWLAERIDRPVTEIEPGGLTVEGLQPYHVLIIRDVSSNHTPGLSFSSAQAEALWEWVRGGGGLMTLIGYSDATEIYNVNRLLEPFNLSYGSEQIVQGEGQAAPVTQWFEHPLSQGIERLGADNGYPAAGQGFTFAAEQGYDFGKAATIGDGHVLVWGDEWITYENEWLGVAEFQVDRFWQNALRWLTRATECQVPPAQ